MRFAEPLRGWACGLALSFTVAGGVGFAGEPAASTPSATSATASGDACPGVALVDDAFRDAALQALQALVIHAPGLPADGAVQAHHSAGHVDPVGQAWHYVSAYQVNLAFIGALAVAPRLAGDAAGWLRWQAAHTSFTGPGQGVVFDHWVRAQGFAESTCPPGMAAETCPRVDAYDSTAASLLLLADAYASVPVSSSASIDADTPGGAALLRTPSMRIALEAAAGTLAAMTQRQGLSWAKPDHQVAYLMDAVEVAAGWRAWARLQAAVYGVPQAAQSSLAAARRLDAAVVRHLWHAPSQTWRVSLGAPAPDFGRWYPDTVAQAWPLLWNESAEPQARVRAAGAWRQAARAWQGPPGWSAHNVDPAGFWWPAVAVAARCQGDEPGTRAWVDRARRDWLRPDAPFAWPFQVGDLRWLLRLASPVAP
ncbi:MAG: hypothetical protein JWQ88_1623 [Rhodoferax sp.]|nr:hypothetical protein [Rhodoferax sp.]